MAIEGDWSVFINFKDESLNMAYYEDPSQVPDALAIPEAVYWKRNVLNALFSAVEYQSLFYATPEPETSSRLLLAYQSAVIALYSILREKLNKKETEQLTDLQQFTTQDIFVVIEDKYEKRTQIRRLPVAYLNKCLATLNAAIERIGITRIEIAQPDGRHLLKRA